jgi:hexosaminidase
MQVEANTVAHIWKGNGLKEVNRTTHLGLQTLYSSCWYLNRISMGPDWHHYYACDPREFNGIHSVELNVLRILGGAIYAWGP